LVRLNGLVRKPELNGCVGVVKALGEERLQVDVFLNNEFTDPQSLDNIKLSDFFQSFLLKPENMLLIKSEDWKTDFLAPAKSSSEIDRLMHENLSADQYAQCQNAGMHYEKISRKIFNSEVKEKLQIVAVWMNQAFGTSVVDDLPVLSPFKRGAFVFVEGLVSKPEYNGHVGLVMNRGDERTEVMIFLPEPERLRAMTAVQPEHAFKSLLLRDQNMRLLTREDWKYERERSVAEQHAEFMENFLINTQVFQIPNRLVTRTLTNDQKSELKSIKNLIEAMCGGVPSELQNDSDLRRKGILIGAWINLRYGWFGMSYACNYGSERNYGFVPAIDRLWDGIGDWLN
jgi:hypothetical protein